jgi:hypothetical protein
VSVNSSTVFGHKNLMEYMDCRRRCTSTHK